ncbi:MAG: hypothetical protein AB8B48_19120 [Pseudomonadales bacterium]
MMKVVAVLTVSLGVIACSNQQIYDASRHDAQLDCQKLPQNQYEECMKEVTETYDSYARKREEVISEQ